MYQLKNRKGISFRTYRVLCISPPTNPFSLTSFGLFSLFCTSYLLCRQMVLWHKFSLLILLDNSLLMVISCTLKVIEEFKHKIRSYSCDFALWIADRSGSSNGPEAQDKAHFVSSCRLWANHNVHSSVGHNWGI